MSKKSIKSQIKNPLISIGLLTYNQEEYIASTLEGVLSQEYTPIELIILDDASTDRTSEVIEQYMERLTKKFVRVLHIRNDVNTGNISQNANRMIREARGSFYYGTSGDDIMLSNAICLLYETFLTHPDCGIVHANMIPIGVTYQYGEPVDLGDLFVKNKKSSIEPVDFFEKLMCDNCVAAPTVLIRKELFDQYGYHDENILYEDYEYWLRLSRNERFYFLNEPVVLYRRTEASITNFESKNNQSKLQLAMESLFLTKQKYIRYLGKEEQIKCWEGYYAYYFRICTQYQYEKGLKWLEDRGKETNVNLDEYRIDYSRAIKIKQGEEKILRTLAIIENNPEILGIYLRNLGLRSVAIYGYSKLGKMLQRELLNSGVSVKYVIDRKGKMLECQLPIYTLNDSLPSIDGVIIAPVGLYETVSPLLNQKVRAKIIDLIQIIESVLSEELCK